MNTANFITKNIEGITVRYDKDTGFICASDMCKLNDKKPWSKYIRLKITEEFIATFNYSREEIIKSIEGRNGGTWVHQDIAIHLAMWISPQCGRAVINIVTRYINGDLAIAKEVVENKNEIDGNYHTLEVATNPINGNVKALAEAYDPEDQKSMDVLQEKYDELEIRCKEAEDRADDYLQKGQEAAAYFKQQKEIIIADKHVWITDAETMRKKLASMPKKNSFYNRDYVKEAFNEVLQEAKAKAVHLYLEFDGGKVDAYETYEDFQACAEDPEDIDNLSANWRLSYKKTRNKTKSIYHSTLYLRKSKKFEEHPCLNGVFFDDYGSIEQYIYDINLSNL